jgi:hypothetical protein
MQYVSRTHTPNDSLLQQSDGLTYSNNRLDEPLCRSLQWQMELLFVPEKPAALTDTVAAKHILFDKLLLFAKKCQKERPNNII